MKNTKVWVSRVLIAAMLLTPSFALAKSKKGGTVKNSTKITSKIDLFDTATLSRIKERIDGFTALDNDGKYNFSDREKIAAAKFSCIGKMTNEEYEVLSKAGLLNYAEDFMAFYEFSEKADDAYRPENPVVFPYSDSFDKNTNEGKLLLALENMLAKIPNMEKAEIAAAINSYIPQGDIISNADLDSDISFASLDHYAKFALGSQIQNALKIAAVKKALKQSDIDNIDEIVEAIIQIGSAEIEARYKEYKNQLDEPDRKETTNFNDRYNVHKEITANIKAGDDTKRILTYYINEKYLSAEFKNQFFETTTVDFEILLDYMMNLSSTTSFKEFTDILRQSLLMSDENIEVVDIEVINAFSDLYQNNPKKLYKFVLMQTPHNGLTFDMASTGTRALMALRAIVLANSMDLDEDTRNALKGVLNTAMLHTQSSMEERGCSSQEQIDSLYNNLYGLTSARMNLEGTYCEAVAENSDEILNLGRGK